MFYFETKKQLAFDFKMETVLEEARAIIKGKISIKPYISQRELFDESNVDDM